MVFWHGMLAAPACTGRLHLLLPLDNAPTSWLFNQLLVDPMLVLHARAEPGCGGQVAVMSPGMYELSDYSLSWASADPGRQADGLYNGRPFLLQVNM